MKALLFHHHGEADVLRYEDIPTPRPQAGEALVRVFASALNHLDVFVRRGWPGLKLTMPHVGGADGAGIVQEIGPGETDISVGDRVAIYPGILPTEDEFTRRGIHSQSPSFYILGEGRRGAFADYVSVPIQNLVPMPDDATFEDTAAAQLVFLTAWRMLIVRGKLRAGETVLFVGSGGVNTAGLQVAKLAGAVVYVLTRSQEKMDRAKALGADHVLSYRTGNWPSTIQEMTGKRGVDLIVDNVGQATFQQSILALRRGGRLITVGATSGPKPKIDLRYVFIKQLQVIGSTLGSPQEFLDVMKLVWTGRLKPVIDREIPLEQGAEGYRLMEQGGLFGKIVLKP